MWSIRPSRRERAPRREVGSQVSRFSNWCAVSKDKISLEPILSRCRRLTITEKLLHSWPRTFSMKCSACSSLSLWRRCRYDANDRESRMTQLARQLRVADYFSLGWGTMVGVGWLVVMDDWLMRGGPLGGILGFAIGGVLLLPIGHVYGKLVMAMPVASGEVAYTAKVFPRPVTFSTGWSMMLAYFIVC